MSIETSRYFPILSLSKNILQYITEFCLESHHDQRNFCISCKTVYKAIPEHLRQKYLCSLQICLNQITKTDIRLSQPIRPNNNKRYMYCTDCGAYVKHITKHKKKCVGLKQCNCCLGYYYVKSPHSFGNCNIVARNISMNLHKYVYPLKLKLKLITLYEVFENIEKSLYHRRQFMKKLHIYKNKYNLE